MRQISVNLYSLFFETWWTIKWEVIGQLENDFSEQFLLVRNKTLNSTKKGKQSPCCYLESNLATGNES